MLNFIKEKKVIIATILCGVLMVGGWITEKSGASYFPLIYVLGMIIGGFYQTTEGIRETLEEKHLSVDLLMALAAIGACTIGYWFEGIMLTFIFSLSGSLEEYTTNKSNQEISGLLEMQPVAALRLATDGSTTEVPVEELEIGERLLVPKGGSIPIDGMIVSGVGLCDEASITGESIPVEKGPNEDVFAGTINVGNAFEMTVSKKSSDTLFSKIVKMVEEAQNTPSKTASFIDRLENTYVKVVLVLVPLMIFIPYLFLGWSWNESFYRGMVLLVVASPCALVAAATPATLAAISSGARNGVLFKGGIFLEQFAELKQIYFDKTGTLTNGNPVVTDSFFLDEETKEQEINILVTLEKNSTHPLATAITNEFASDVTDPVSELIVDDLTGSGLLGHLGETEWRVGKADFALKAGLDTQTEAAVERLQAAGKTIIFLAKNQQLVAYFALLDLPREDALPTLTYFHEEGIKTTLVTGDHVATATAVGNLLKIDHVYAGYTPEEKANLIKEQTNAETVTAMVGDGVNDAPALANATLGVAMGQGTDIAIEVADIVLMRDNLANLQMTHRLAKKLKRIVMQNIIFSVSVIVLLIIGNFFQAVSLPLGVIGHEGSTILVILNGLRMLRTMKPKYTADELEHPKEDKVLA